MKGLSILPYIINRITYLWHLSVLVHRNLTKKSIYRHEHPFAVFIKFSDAHWTVEIDVFTRMLTEKTRINIR